MERLCVDTYPGLAATPLKRGRATRDHDILQRMGTGECSVTRQRPLFRGVAAGRGMYHAGGCQRKWKGYVLIHTPSLRDTPLKRGRAARDQIVYSI